MNRNFVFTSESVTSGHPDKLCDQISDAIVDRYLAEDPTSRVIAECAVASGILFLAVHFASRAKVDLPEVARAVIEDVGYVGEGFNARDCTIMTTLQELPAPLPDGRLNAADPDRVMAQQSVTVFGFACNHTPTMLPLPIHLAHKLARRLDLARLDGHLPYLAPDGQTQVGVTFRDRTPQRIYSVAIVTSQWEGRAVAEARLREGVMEHVVMPAFQDEVIALDGRTQVAINPAGLVIGGGPALHAGLTGRKNAIDTYGEYCRHSGAALSGKDPGRIDRIGAYAVRHAAKQVVSAGLARECELAVSYSIGKARPVSVYAQTFGTGVLPDGILSARLERHFDFRPAAIARRFDLQRLPEQHPAGFYRKLAVYGQMGRLDLDPPWERLDEADALREWIKPA
jgi:S-adenosylmethionine synthetase